MRQSVLADYESSGIDCPVCGRRFGTKNGLQSHFGWIHKDKHLTVELFGEHRIRDLYSRMSENAVAEHFGVERSGIQSALNHLGIDRRGQSEAEQLKWDQMTPAERKAQVKAAHEKNRELAADGELSLQQWRREHPDEAHEHSVKWGSTLAERRETNGMKGVTGQGHPNWRGGKSIYDAVKKQLPGPSWATIRDRYTGDPCVGCGEMTTDLHHIVPILCGGTNDDYNLMPLCPSCHHKTEWHFRDILNPVLVA